VEDAEAVDPGLTLCLALGLAGCPISLWVGDLAAAKRYTKKLVDRTREFGLPFYSRFGAHFEAVLLIANGGHLEVGLRILGIAVDELTERRSRYRIWDGVTELAEALGRAGRFNEALALVDIGIEVSDGGYVAPELLRLKGELLWLETGPAGAEATKLFYQQALYKARQQGALSWELRAAMSLARLLRDQGRVVDALRSLQPVYNRFTEGFDTADLVAARKLLDELRDACHV